MRSSEKTLSIGFIPPLLGRPEASFPAGLQGVGFMFLHHGGRFIIGVFFRSAYLLGLRAQQAGELFEIAAGVSIAPEGMVALL